MQAAVLSSSAGECLLQWAKAKYLSNLKVNLNEHTLDRARDDAMKTVAPTNSTWTGTGAQTKGLAPKFKYYGVSAADGDGRVTTWKPLIANE